MRWAFVIVLASALTGCDRAPEASPTFNKDVAPIVFQHCLPCHREGQPVPFTLAAYSDLRSRVQAIARVTQSRKMPPWLPEPGEPAFFGERRLRDDQIETIRRWVEAGAPEGDPADLPKAPTWPAGWELGQPDLVVTLPRPYVLKPGAHDAYRNLVFPRDHSSRPVRSSGGIPHRRRARASCRDPRRSRACVARERWC